MKHKHYDLIVAWAAGKEVQFKSSDNTWEFVGVCPLWVENFEYRIKPTPKPDVVKHFLCDFAHCTVMFSDEARYRKNLRLIFDGESGELTSAEVLK
jgi:hypothetical protein